MNALQERVNELQQALEKAEAARSEAQAAAKAKDAFLAMVSHELRGPLSAIMGWTQVLRTGTADIAHALDVIERSAQIQRLLIDELMDVSRVSTRELTLSVTDVDLVPLVQEVIEAGRPAASARQIDLTCNTRSEPTVIVGDTLRLNQIVTNILSNALKFTPEGGSVAVTLTAGDGYAQLEVIDTGIGIAPEILDHIFEPFWQARRASDAYRGGLGLGLPIVRRLVHLHGGSIRAVSEGKGRGTRIIVRFDLAGHVQAQERRRADRGGDSSARPPDQWS